VTKNPFINAGAASVYIICVATLMYNAKTVFGSKDTFLTPIAVLSLFTLSAAVMGYLFLYQPVLELLEGHKKKAVDLFLKTVAVFAGITLVVFLIMLSGVFK